MGAWFRFMRFILGLTYLFLFVGLIASCFWVYGCVYGLDLLDFAWLFVHVLILWGCLVPL